MILTSTVCLALLASTLTSSVSSIPTDQKSSKSTLYKSWAEVPRNGLWHSYKNPSGELRSVIGFKPTFSGHIVNDRKFSYDFNADKFTKIDESDEQRKNRLTREMQKIVEGLPEDDIASVFFVGIVMKDESTIGRNVMLYIDSTPKDDTRKIGSVVIHYIDARLVLQSLDDLLDLARRWRMDGTSHEEREKSYTYGSTDADQFTVTISQRPGSDNLMWQVFGREKTEFTSNYTKFAQFAPQRSFVLDKKGIPVFDKSGNALGVKNDGFSEFSMFVGQLRKVVDALSALKP